MTAGSTETFEDAVRARIAKSGETLRNIQGAWVSEQKVDVQNGEIAEFRITLRISFLVD